jgi:hypothetical protein
VWPSHDGDDGRIFFNRTWTSLNVQRILNKQCRALSVSIYENFQAAPEETEGRFVSSIGDHSLYIPAFFLLRGSGFFDIEQS